MRFGSGAAATIQMPRSIAARLEQSTENAVLFDQIDNYARLLAIGPGGEGRQEEPEVDGLNHPGSISAEQQIVALQHIRVFGHYADGVDHRRLEGPHKRRDRGFDRALAGLRLAED